MNPRSSSYTGRAPRSLNEAFGPYTSSQHFTELNPPRTDWSGIFIAAVVLVVVAVVLVSHWMGS